MDWKDIGRIIAPLAPTLGGVLGGLIPFPGGALAGTALGNIIARQFGVEPTPQAVGDALARMSHEEKLAALNAATERARIEVDGFVKAEHDYFETLRLQIGEQGQTMRMELRSDVRHPYYTGWRAACGWMFVVFGSIFGVIFMYGLAADQVIVDRIVLAWPILLAFFGLLAAMVGVPIIQRPTPPVTSPVPATPAKPVAKK